MNKVEQYLEGAVKSIDISDQESAYVELLITEDFPGFDGHFEGEPILPGVCYIQALMFLAKKQIGSNLILKEVVLAKFTAVVKPGDELSIKAKTKTVGNNVFVIKSIMCSGAVTVAKIDVKVESQ